MTIAPTAAEIARFWPRANPAWAEAFVRLAPAVMAEHRITTRRRLRHFMAQISAETDGLSLKDMRESMAYTAAGLQRVFDHRLGRMLARDRADLAERGIYTKAQLADELVQDREAQAEMMYGHRPELGNTEAGDGFRFIGRGPMQTTGREAYAKVGRMIGADLVADPTLLEQPAHGIRAAFADWTFMRCNEVADTDDVVAVSRRVNGGTNGLEARKRWYAKACAVWPDAEDDISAAASAGPGDLARGSAGAAVRELQTDLRRLGYFPGAVDGQFGERTEDALVLFQRHHALEPTGALDAATRAALGSAPPREIGPRAEADLDTLREAGGRKVALADGQKRDAALAATGVGTAVLHQLDVLPAPETITTWWSALAPIVDVLKAHPWLIRGALAAGLVWTLYALARNWLAARRIQQIALEEYRSGAYLGR